jgi:hypothetical protein
MRLEIGGKTILLLRLPLLDEIEMYNDLRSIGALPDPEIVPETIPVGRKMLWEELDWQHSGLTRIAELVAVNEVQKIAITPGSPGLTLIESYGKFGK